ncbi:hypothetical protein CVT25_013418 [Psilocybe cyanescens]|uniref:Uncharacterized protein n=1 Tax=Psilocybe cyanescens TaxID=93625 RepID=A0A409WSS3_PSICY|nr:hypothetical protein CVT25_013418 [Psilocybe cyanescens]
MDLIALSSLNTPTNVDDTIRGLSWVNVLILVLNLIARLLVPLTPGRAWILISITWQINTDPVCDVHHCQSDLIFLKGNTTAFSSALIANAPVRKISTSCPVSGRLDSTLFNFICHARSSCPTLQNDILASFDTTIAAYA